jgi:hypothetical protein
VIWPQSEKLYGGELFAPSPRSAATGARRYGVVCGSAARARFAAVCHHKKIHRKPKEGLEDHLCDSCTSPVVVGFPPAVVQSSQRCDFRSGRQRIAAFRSSWFHRRILAAERRIVNEHADTGFIAIRPAPRCRPTASESAWISWVAFARPSAEYRYRWTVRDPPATEIALQIRP